MRAFGLLSPAVSALAISVALSATASRAQVPAVAAAPASHASAPADATPLQFKRDDDGAAAAVASWLTVVALAGVGLVLVHRRQGRGKWLDRLLPARGPDHALQVLGGRALGNGAALHVVRWGGRELLVGSTQQHVQVLMSRGVGEGESP